MTTKKYIITADDVEDNLTSTLQDVPLSANQGRILNAGKVDKNQGTAQAGKVLGIGADGLVYPVNNTLPIASESTLGGVKVGSGLSVTPDGTLSASGGRGVVRINVSGTSYVSGINILKLSPLCIERRITYDGISGTARVAKFPLPISGTIKLGYRITGTSYTDMYIRTVSLSGDVMETETPIHYIDNASRLSTINIALTDCIELACSVKTYGTSYMWSPLTSLDYFISSTESYELVCE